MIEQASVLLNKTIVPPAEIGQEFFTAYSCAAQETKRSITNSYIARKSIEFYLKNTFKDSAILEEYNFYNERNLNRLKLFVENLLAEATKISPNNQSFLLTEENEGTLRTGDIKDRDLRVIGEQMNELKRCLRHFLNSLGEITKAEAKYLDGVEKSNLFKIDQKYKTNKQALFQESEDLINFTNTLIYNLESVDRMINKILASQGPKESIVIENNEERRSVRFESKAQQTDDAIFDDKLSHISKDVNSAYRPLVSKENAPYSTNWDENNYFSEFSEQREKRSPTKGLTSDDVERKIQQLLQTNKTLEDLLESKEDTLKQTKRSLLKEVQDSNNLRIQLKKMIEENMQVKNKLDEALRLNDEFERMLAENKEQTQEGFDHSREELHQIETQYEDEIKYLTDKTSELFKENEYLKQANMEIKMENLVLNQQLEDSESPQRYHYQPPPHNQGSKKRDYY